MWPGLGYATPTTDPTFCCGVKRQKGQTVFTVCNANDVLLATANTRADAEDQAASYVPEANVVIREEARDTAERRWALRVLAGTNPILASATAHALALAEDAYVALAKLADTERDVLDRLAGVPASPANSDLAYRYRAADEAVRACNLLARQINTCAQGTEFRRARGLF